MKVGEFGSGQTIAIHGATQRILTVGVELRATLNDIAGDPYGLAGLEVGCLRVERHRSRFLENLEKHSMDSGGIADLKQQGVKLVEVMRHPRGEGRASLATVKGKVEGLRDGRMSHLVMVAPWFDRASCFENQASGVADLDW